MARLYVFVECVKCLQSLFQQNKMNVLFREIARLIARNSLPVGRWNSKSCQFHAAHANFILIWYFSSLEGNIRKVSKISTSEN